MAVTINGTTGVTYPAGGTDNVAGSGVGTTDTQTLTNKTIASLVTTGTASFGGIINTGSTGQVQFPATQNPSSDANTLDDYEEGTWTPALNNFTGSAGWAASGTYVKIGRIVYLDVTLSPGSGTISATANSSTISGLPFSVAKAAVVGWSTNYIETLGTGVIYPTSSVLYTSTFSVTNIKTIYSSGVYITAT
jgi:hypothetical protein